MRIDPELAGQAIDVTLDVLAERMAGAYGKPEEIERYKEFMRSSITSAPEQYTQEGALGDVSLPLNTVALLLGVIAEMQFELRHLTQYETAHYENLEKWTEAIKAFNNPRETSRAKYNQDALDKLDLNARSRSVYDRILREFNALTNGPEKVSITEAHEMLGQKYNKDPGAIRKGLERQRKKSNP